MTCGSTCGWQCGCCCDPCPGISPSEGRSARRRCSGCSWDTHTPYSSTDYTPGQRCPLRVGPRFLSHKEYKSYGITRIFYKAVTFFLYLILQKKKKKAAPTNSKKTKGQQSPVNLASKFRGPRSLR